VAAASPGLGPKPHPEHGFLAAARQALRDHHHLARRLCAARRRVQSGQRAVFFEALLRRARQPRSEGALWALEDALELWRGNAFEDASIPAVAAEVARLTELRYAALEDLFQLRLTTGAGVDISDLAARVEAAPLRQRLRGLLMTVLQRAGRQAEALEVYRAGARLLAQEHGLDPSPELRLLHESILRHHPAAGSGDVPRQLPACPADFTGRQNELNYLHKLVAEAAAAAQPGTPLVVGISGMAGVGKTALAVRASHDLQSQFAGGCLYANLHGSVSPAPASHVLGAFLRACGVTGSALPSNVEERAALYRTLLAERNLLVVLDNATSEEQVEPLLPGARGTVLLTSRRPLVGLPGIRLLRLEVLPEDDAVDLLGAVVGKDRIAVEPVAAQSIVALCGGLPLAVRVAAVRLAANDKLSLASLRTRLADERGRLDELALADLDVRASLALGCRELSERQALLWQVLCVLPLEEVPFELVPPTLGVSSGQAHRLLEDLAGAHLVNAVEPDRYQIHDLIRILGRELAERRLDGEVVALARRACEHLWRRAREAAGSLPCRPIPVALAQPGPVDEIAEPVEFFERELGNIVSIIRFALSNQDVELAAGLAACLTNFCLMRGYTDQWEQSHRLVLEHRSAANPKALAAVELGMGTLQRFCDRNRIALSHLRRAYQIFGREGDRLGQAVALLSWAIAVRTLGRTEFAASATATASSTLELITDWPIQLGYALMTRYHLEADPSLLRRALALFDSCAERWGAAEVHSLLADWYRKDGELDVAEHHLHEAMDLYAGLGDRVDHLVTRLQLAQICLARGAHEAAGSVLMTALPAAERLRHPWCLATTHRLLGELLLGKDDAVQAVSHLERAEAILRAAGNRLALALTLEALAKARALVGEPDVALASGREAYETLRRLRPAAAEELRAWLGTLPPHGSSATTAVPKHPEAG
jgi:tetratricopeptide (TPR) repeat protein